MHQTGIGRQERKSMNRGRRRVLVFVMLMFCLCIIKQEVSAESVSKDGVEVSLTTDKDSYSTEDQIVTILSAKNTKDTPVYNICLESVIPKGFKTVDSASVEKTSEMLNPGESISLTINYVSNPVNSGESDNSGLEDNSSTSDTGNKSEITQNNLTNNVQQNSDKNTAAKNNTENPKTGDNSAVVLWAMIMILSLIVIGVFAIRKHIKKILSVFFVATLAYALMAGITSNVYAAYSEQKTVNINKTIKVVELEIKMEAVVTYTELNSNSGEETTQKIETQAQEITNVIASGDMEKINQIIFDYQELKVDEEIDEENSSEGILKKIFTKDSIQVKKINEDTIEYEIKAPNLSHIFEEITENENISTDEAFKEYLMNYIDKAENKKITISVPYTVKDGKILANYKDKEFINAITGGLLESYQKMYQSMIDEYK